MSRNLENLLNKIKDCSKCPKLEPWKKFNSYCHGNISSKAMIISEAPGEKSIERDKYWSGASGNKLRKTLKDAYKVELEDIFYFSDIVKCCPKKNRTPKDEEVNSCNAYLQEELNILKPKIVLVFGNTALSYFISNCSELSELKGKGITELHNRNGYKVFRLKDFVLVPMIHPSRPNDYMDYDIYKQHLKEVFKMVIESYKS